MNDLTATLVLAIGALITLLDGAARYNTRDRLNAGMAGSVDIPPRYFTSERGYIASVLLYLAIMQVIYFAPAIAIPRSPVEDWLNATPLDDAAKTQLRAIAGAGTFPIIWSLLLVGALRYLPWINNLEPAIRQLCHNIAEIPRYVHELSRMLYSVEMNVSTAFPEGYRDDLMLVAAGDFNAPASSEERAWARLSYVMRELEETYTELGALPAVQFGARFAEEYENAASEFRSLRYRMAGYVEERKGGARSSALGADHRFKADLRRAFSRAALLLVVLLNLKSRSQEQISAKLRALGFKTGPHAIAEGEVGPDAAVTALVLALVLFVVCPLVTIGVDIAMNEVIGRGFAAPYHDYRYPDLIIYPATILHANGANLATRVPITFVMTFFSLMTLAVVNLTIARRFAGISPGEMFTGDWLRRPYFKYFRAAALSAVLCLGSGMLLVYLMILGGFGSQMPGGFNPLGALIWLAPMFLIALSLQVFAQNKGHSLVQVLGEGFACGLVWAGVSYVATFFFFTALHEINGKPILSTEVLGAALYSACTGFFIGMPFTALLLFVSKSARAGATQSRVPVLVASNERAAA